MRSIGGYFELEIKKNKEFHNKAVGLNLGRNALEYIIRANNYTTIHVPYYTCNAVLQPLNNLNINYKFYSIDESFEPIFDFNTLAETDAFLYTNYYGIKDGYIHGIKGNGANIIIDNSQAFFSLPIEGFHTFYSARKFFGVPDGAYLYTSKLLEEPLDIDLSFNRCEHLLKRLDSNPEEGYAQFIANERTLDDVPLLHMSNLTRSLLQSVDYKSVQRKRRQNFDFLHTALKKKNRLHLTQGDSLVPMIYPFFSDDPSLRSKLFDHRIYVPVFWQSVLQRVQPQSIEHLYVENLIHLPIDQRYGLEDLQRILDIIGQ